MSSGELHQEDRVDEDDTDETVMLQAEQDPGDFSNRAIRARYKGAGAILIGAVQSIVKECVPKARVAELCILGDSAIKEGFKKTFTNAVSKGLAFPTSICVNHVICNFSPMLTDQTVLEANDLVKINMACHVDGFLVVTTHTHVVTDGPIIGRMADVISAAETAKEIIINLVKPGTELREITDVIHKVASVFHCKVLNASHCHQLKRFYTIKPSQNFVHADEVDEESIIMKNKAYMIDIALSTTEDKIGPLGEVLPTIYKNIADDNYELQSEELRPVFEEIRQKYRIMPFCTRDLGEAAVQKLEACVQHDILQPYPIQHVKSGILVAHIRFTVFIGLRDTVVLNPHKLQELRPMISIKNNPDIKILRRSKGREKDADEKELIFSGRLAIGKESCGVRPVISDISWNPKPACWTATEAFACTGSFGTYVYRRPTSIAAMKLKGDIEEEWKKELVLDDPGRFCTWSPNGRLLAIGLVTEGHEIGEVHIIGWNDNFNHEKIYQGNPLHCKNMNSLSWSSDSSYLVLASKVTRHVVVIRYLEKKKENKVWVRTLPFSGQATDLVAVFHPETRCFIAGATTGRMEFYRHSEEEDVWLNRKGWSEDYGIIDSDLAFNRNGTKLACAKLNCSIKVWKYDTSPAAPNITELYTVANVGPCDLSVKWNHWNVDFLAVGDAGQAITIYDASGNHVCDNRHSVDSKALFSQANQVDWHPKEAWLLASGGAEGFILFWSHKRVQADGFTKERRIHHENLFYSHFPLQAGIARSTVQNFDVLTQNFRQSLVEAMEDVEGKDSQLARIAYLAKSGLERLDGGEKLSQAEFRSYSLEILQFSTKKL
ncbi:hypothetical protein EJB05_36464 [Eragrostis curvula]|uniref:Peptidase M24 domain-containing protein n=1 Tax=Eragrostis curvula TaxID=38414 RepID=A0A5J9UAP7_9POAL|nr:hypothetical protein EJB05_36464 [Eragrostis curvula]